MIRLFIILVGLAAVISATAEEGFAPSVAGYTTQSTDPLLMGSYYTHLGRVGDYSKNYVHVGFAFFDLDVHPALREKDRRIGLSLKLDGIVGTPAPMRMDFVGTFPDTALDQSRFSSPSVFSLSSVMTKTSSPGLYTFDVSAMHHVQLTDRFAVFRFYQEGFISSNSVTDCYSISPSLNESWLHTIPEIDLSIFKNTDSASASFMGVGQFSYQLEHSTDLKNWTLQGSRMQGADELIELSIGTGTASSMFFRIEISKSP